MTHRYCPCVQLETDAVFALYKLFSELENGAEYQDGRVPLGAQCLALT